MNLWDALTERDFQWLKMRQHATKKDFEKDIASLFTKHLSEKIAISYKSENDAGMFNEKIRVTARDLITQALVMTGGNRTEAAILLGISRAGLVLKIKSLGIRL